MKAKPDCTVCLLSQYLKISRLSGLEEDVLEKGFYQLIREIPDAIKPITPVEMAARMTSIIHSYSGIRDPYMEIKRKSNMAALSLVPDLKKRINLSAHPLQEALSLAIAGNLIDFGVNANLNIKDALDEILSKPVLKNLENGTASDDDIFQFNSFYSSLKEAENLVYLGDNAGEIVFDRLFIEEILREFPDKRITFVVRGGPALNDVLEEDAETSGITELCRVINSGCAAAGTVLSKTSAEFKSALDNADLVISKGQGNYETLFGEALPLTYFLFRIKCEIVAKDAGGDLGRLALKKNIAAANLCCSC